MNAAQRPGYSPVSSLTSFPCVLYQLSLSLPCKCLSIIATPIMLTDPGCSTYWMAGLAPDAALYFKFLFILVLYTLSMTLFVRSISCLVLMYSSLLRPLELPPRDSVQQWRHRDPSFSAHRSIPDDLCGFFRPSHFYTPCAPMAAVVLSAQVCAGSALRERGTIRVDDRGQTAGRSGKRVRHLDHAIGAWNGSVMIPLIGD
jgi:hypothetical protein